MGPKSKPQALSKRPLRDSSVTRPERDMSAKCLAESGLAFGAGDSTGCF